MKFSRRWLEDWVAVEVPTEVLCDQLTNAGLEVDGVEPVAGLPVGVVVAEVESVAAHPDAGKLKVCQVNDGSGTVTVVCGAPNVRPGMVSALATLGTVLPDGTKVGRAKLRGIASDGMLCSEIELGLGSDDSGIVDLGTDFGVPTEVLVPGRDLADVLNLDDVSIDLDLTPNRGDALSIRGLAREVGLLNHVPLSPPTFPAVPVTTDAAFPVKIENPDRCARYLGRVIEDVDVTRQAPWWLRERLRRCGLRSIDPIVDVTNYVLLELGQPMHAFDLDRLAGGIVVRDANPGEALTLLDRRAVAVGSARPESEGEDAPRPPLLITDGNGPVAIAGVMGGERSAVAATTRNVFLECAFFAPLGVAATARRFGLHTDAAHRYERGVDYRLQSEAVERATGLLLELVGGRAGPVVEAVSEAHLPRPNTVRLRKRRLDRLVGEEIPAAEVQRIFESLELAPTTEGEGEARVWTVTSPSHRFDIEREEDLVEEVLRIHGYNTVASRIPPGTVPLGQPVLTTTPAARLADLLVDLGYTEAVTYSFVDPKLADVLDPADSPIRIHNPVSSEHAVMRTSLLPGLVGALQRNLARQAQRVRLFETGQCFRTDDDGELHQVTLCGGILYGPRHEQNWAQDAVAADFFDVKGDVERLLAMGGRRADFAPLVDPALHPGQAAAVSLDGTPVGRCGRLHPEVAGVLDLPADVFVFEMAAAALLAGRRRAYGGLSRQPSVRRDLALVVDRDVPAARIEAVVRHRLGDLVKSFRLFDLYTGDGIEIGCKGVGIGLTFQHPSRTLGEAEINQQVDDALAVLKSELGARLR